MIQIINLIQDKIAARDKIAIRILGIDTKSIYTKPWTLKVSSMERRRLVIINPSAKALSSLEPQNYGEHAINFDFGLTRKERT